ncbi:uncharacterized protein LOC114526399 isoform X2 [Dendronephthya gigantea]|nr:uncharacterized protein LOC114526399 isoform X2 [Dendronephthya gigantea]
MNASIVKREYIDRAFCTKFTQGSENLQRTPWGRGSYCIYRKQGFCPNDMVGGSIIWDDEDENNGNDEKGHLPDLDSGDNTRLFYCCQNKGKWYDSILLPTENPFYLLPYGSRNCQRVIGAVSSLEYIVYDTEDIFNGDDFDGHHVFTDKNSSSPKMYYCYYEGCQHYFQNDVGSFGSPNYINSFYPDFQYCSWSLTVNASLRISLEFLSLNIPNCEENSIDVYDGQSDNASKTVHLATFCGVNATSGAKVTSRTNRLFIVLKSGNNSLWNEDLSKRIQFYAVYESFPTAAALNNNRHLRHTGNLVIYLVTFLPLLLLLILLLVAVTIICWRRHHKDKKDVNTEEEQPQNDPAVVEGFGVAENSAYENDADMQVIEVNPIYQGIDENDCDPTYAIPTM